MSQRPPCTALLAIVALVLGAPSVRVHGATDASALAQQVCSSCHGPRGNSGNPEIPSLAGQGALYLEQQLLAFKAQRRHGVMSGVASGLSAADARALATYFSQQPPRWNPERSAAAQDSRRGRSIYLEGIDAKHVPACASCHALDGSGLPPEFPRLAGQHAAYVDSQLRKFRAGNRLSNPNAMMRVVSAPLSDADIRAVSTYIEALR